MLKSFLLSLKGTSSLPKPLNQFYSENWPFLPIMELLISEAFFKLLGTPRNLPALVGYCSINVVMLVSIRLGLGLGLGLGFQMFQVQPNGPSKFVVSCLKKYYSM